MKHPLEDYDREVNGHLVKARPLSPEKYLVDALRIKNSLLRESNKVASSMIVKGACPTFVEGLTTGGIFGIITSNYEQYKDVFGADSNDKGKFNMYSQHVTSARNKYQHNCDQFLDKNFKDLTKVYCEFFVNKIEEYLGQ